MSGGGSPAPDTRGPDDPGIVLSDEHVRELAGTLAAGYLRLLARGIGAPKDPTTSDVSATCGREDSAHHGHEELDVLATQRDQL